ASDPTQVSGPSIEAAGGHFVMVNGSAMQRARVSSPEELSTYRTLISELRDVINVPPAELQRYQPDEYDVIVISSLGNLTGPDVDNVVLPGGRSLRTIGSAVAGWPTESSEVRCLTVSESELDSYITPLDDLEAWNSENGAWLFTDGAEGEVLVRIE